MKLITKTKIEVLIIIILSILIFIISSQIDLFEMIHEFIESHESWELDEILPVLISLSIFLLIFSVRRLLENKKALKKLEKNHMELQEAHNEIKTLSGLLPVCSKCRKIKNSEGYWQSLETYIMKHTDALITHGLCEDCVKELYGEEFLEDIKQSEDHIKE